MEIYNCFEDAQNLNVQRLYEKAFDQVLISPTPLWQFIAGQIIGGSLRGFYAGGVILVLTMPIDTGLIFNGWSFLVMFLNGAVFSAIGVVVSFLAKNHADVPRFSNYIIMPMAYLCNTFFSTEKLPGFLGKFVSALPLSQTSHMIRSISAGEGFAMSGIAIGNGLSGLVHISQICEKRIKKPSEVLAVGDTVKVKVTAIKDGKLSLSIKEATDMMAKEIEEEVYEVPDAGEQATTSLGSLFANIKLD